MATGWDRDFDWPIALPDGIELVSLREAGAYISSLPKATQQRPEWQLAARVLLLVVDCDGPTFLARVAVTRALADLPPGPDPKPKTSRLIR
jgi:hypothetical protein